MSNLKAIRFAKWFAVNCAVELYNNGHVYVYKNETICTMEEVFNLYIKKESNQRIEFTEWCRTNYNSCLGGWTKEDFIAVDNKIHTTEELYDIYLNLKNDG